MVVDLVKRNEELKREVAQLRQRHTALQEQLEKSEVERAREVEKLEAERELLKLKIESLKRMLFGRRSEKARPEDFGILQLELFSEAKEEVEAEEKEEQDEAPVKAHKRRTGRKPIPKEIERRRVVLDVDPELRTCACCSGELKRIGEDITEELEFIPASFYVLEYERPKYACAKCHDGVLMEPLPERPIKKGRPGPGLLAHVAVSKYADYLPLYRQEKIFRRHGIDLKRSTLCGWVQAIAELLCPIVEVMRNELLEARLLQADETRLNTQDPSVKGRLTRAYIWTYGIPWGQVVYDFTIGRSSKGPERFLKGFEGYLQTDAYAGYNSVCRSGRVVHVGCWAHVRRRFYKALGESPEIAKLVLASLQRLYRIERQAKTDAVGGDALVALRRAEALPILEKIKEVIALKATTVLPESDLGVAIRYALSQWQALVRYVEIPEAEIDNNSAEHSMRTVVLGRKNWLFVGHPDAGPRAATLLSLVESCRRLKTDPFAYLRWAIAEMAREPKAAAELTPRKWFELKSAPPAASTENSP